MAEWQVHDQPHLLVMAVKRVGKISADRRGWSDGSVLAAGFCSDQFVCSGVISA